MVLWHSIYSNLFCSLRRWTLNPLESQRHNRTPIVSKAYAAHSSVQYSIDGNPKISCHMPATLDFYQPQRNMHSFFQYGFCCHFSPFADSFFFSMSLFFSLQNKLMSDRVWAAALLFTFNMAHKWQRLLTASLEADDTFVGRSDHQSDDSKCGTAAPVFAVFFLLLLLLNSIDRMRLNIVF